MKLVNNARKIAWRSYSLWANYLGVAALIAPEAIYAIWQTDTNPRLWWIAGLVLILFGIVGRLIDQGINHDDDIDWHNGARSPWPVAVLAVLLLMGMGSAKAPGQPSAIGVASEAEFAAVAVPLVAKWEGKRNKAYLDTIASPPVWTVCYGETRGIGADDHFTDAECRSMLKRGLNTYRAGLHRYFTDQTKTYRLPATRDAAFVSLAWNVGIAGAGRSTATKRLNAGNIAGGCEALTWWTRAGNRVVRGLVRRRADEHRLCMVGAA